MAPRPRSKPMTAAAVGLVAAMVCLAAAAAAAAASPAAGRLQPNDPHVSAAEALLEVGAMDKDATEYARSGIKVLALGREWLDATEEMEQLRASAPDLADQLWMVRTMAKVNGVVGVTAGKVRHSIRKTALRVVTALFDQVVGGTCTALHKETGNAAAPPAASEQAAWPGMLAVYKDKAGTSSLNWPELLIMVDVLNLKKDEGNRMKFVNAWRRNCEALCPAGDGMHATNTAEFCKWASSAGHAVARMHQHWASGNKKSADKYRERFFDKLVLILANRMENLPAADKAENAYDADEKRAVASAAALPRTCARLRGLFMFLGSQEQEKIDNVDFWAEAADSATGAIVSAGKVAASVVAGPAVAAGSEATKKTLSMLSTSLGAGSSLAGVLEGRVASVVADAKKLRMKFRKMLVESSADMLKGNPDWTVGGTQDLPIEPAKCREQLVSLSALWALATGSVKSLHEELKEGDLSGLLLTDERKNTVNGHTDKQKANLVKAYNDLHKLDEKMSASNDLIAESAMTIEKFNSVVKDVTKAGGSIDKLVNMEAAADKVDKGIAKQNLRDQTAGVTDANGKLIDANTAVEAGNLVRTNADASLDAKKAAAEAAEKAAAEKLAAAEAAKSKPTGN